MGETVFCFQPVCSSFELQCGLCTSLAHGKESLGSSIVGNYKLFHYLWLSCIYYRQTRQQLVIKEKKPSPMISLTSLFCHRLIQNSFQVTWTTLQSGNVLAATKGTNIWVLAVASPQILRSQSLQFPQTSCSLE